MSQSLPIRVLEPAQAEKTIVAARKLLEGGQKAARIPEAVSLEELKTRIRKVRCDARDSITSLVTRLQTTLSEKYPAIKFNTAANCADAAGYITQISNGARVVSTNNSSVVTRELRPLLLEKGLTVINSYLGEFKLNEKKLKDYWDLPRLQEKNLNGTFDVVARMDSLPDTPARKYLAVLGVNAIAAEDGSVFFLEHFSNILKDLQQASRVVLIVGLDKIVRSCEEADLQTRCMGIFGMENVILNLGPKPDNSTLLGELALPESKERELHLIVLDNGRSKLPGGKFKDLFLCIGCRACNQHCPIRHSFTGVDYIWTPKTYLTNFLYGSGKKSLDVCLHCEACRLECPLDIDLPYLMWQAKIDYLSRHSTSLQHRILGRPEALAGLGTTLAPFANWMMARKLVRAPMEIVTGIDRRTRLPEFHSLTFRQWFKKNGK